MQRNRLASESLGKKKWSTRGALPSLRLLEHGKLQRAEEGEA